MDIEQPEPLKESNAILDAIAEWGRNNVTRIQFAHGTAGGWEGWAQVEIANHLRQKFSFNYGSMDRTAVAREVSVYNSNRSKADFALVGDRGSVFICELKCESLRNGDNFQGEVLNDVNKLAYTLKDEYKSSPAWVIGLAVTDHVSNMMEGLGLNKYHVDAGILKIWWVNN